MKWKWRDRMIWWFCGLNWSRKDLNLFAKNQSSSTSEYDTSSFSNILGLEGRHWCSLPHPLKGGVMQSSTSIERSSGAVFPFHWRLKGDSDAVFHIHSGASFEGGWGAVAPQAERKKKKRKSTRRKEKKKKKRKKKQKGTMNNVKLLHIKCRLFQLFNSPVASIYKKKFWLPCKSWNDAPVCHCMYALMESTTVATQHLH